MKLCIDYRSSLLRNVIYLQTQAANASGEHGLTIQDNIVYIQLQRKLAELESLILLLSERTTHGPQDTLHTDIRDGYRSGGSRGSAGGEPSQGGAEGQAKGSKGEGDPQA